MVARPAAAVRFEVTTAYGVAYQGTSTDDLGSWNSAYRAVYERSFSGLRSPGRYQVRVSSPGTAVSAAEASAPALAGEASSASRSMSSASASV